MVATFILKNIRFLEELQPRGYFRTILDVICTKYLPDLEQLRLGSIYVITDNVITEPGNDKQIHSLIKRAGIDDTLSVTNDSHVIAKYPVDITFVRKQIRTVVNNSCHKFCLSSQPGTIKPAFKIE